MKIDDKTGAATFSTGRTLYGHRGLWSLDAEGRLFYGYDGENEDTKPFTIEERQELAREMIGRWLAWAVTGGYYGGTDD